MDLMWSNIFRLKSDEESLTGFLERIAVFNELEKRDFKYLENMVHTRTYHANETIFEKGDPGSGMYIIRSGKVLIFNRDIHDQEQEMALLSSGDLFGETTLASPAPRTFSARTTEATELIGLFRSDMLTTTSKHPAIACRILLGLTKFISEQAQRATIEVSALQQRLLEMEHNQQPTTGG
jgi:CRP-like cAMP-binding protein